MPNERGALQHLYVPQGIPESRLDENRDLPRGDIQRGGEYREATTAVLSIKHILRATL
jgi:hypothetical protein